MIRFCDKEVYCVEQSELNRSELFSFFLGEGHRKDIICVIDTDGKFVGKIIYESLLRSDTLENAIQREYVILDKNVWKVGREYFSSYERNLQEFVLLPIVDENKELICFAYEDDEANKELRMLEELENNIFALQFADVFMEYDKVRIYECNELAYYFARYLEWQGIPVEVCGEVWSVFEMGTSVPSVDYRCMNIYAEGVSAKTANMYERYMRSASVEFEYIDILYEKNLKMGTITNGIGDESDLLERIKSVEEIIILGTDTDALDVYDWLKENGLDIVCFVENDAKIETLFDRKVMSLSEARVKFKNPLFLECHEKHSAWSEVADYYNYLGYKRNEDIFFVCDYMKIPESSLLHLLKDREIALVGDIYLCKGLKQWLVINNICVAGYCDVLEEFEEDTSIQKIQKKDIKEKLCLIVVPEIFRIGQNKLEKIKQYKKIIQSMDIKCFTEYFSYVNKYVFTDIEKEKYTVKELMPKGIILGNTESHSGNIFIKGILDNHENILLIPEYGILNDELFWICKRLAGENSKNVLEAFLNYYEENADYPLHDCDKFSSTMKQYLVLKEKFTSQELFVMLQIAYASMWERKIESIENVWIYWDPHFVDRNISEYAYSKWLEASSIFGYSLRLVRNAIMQSGSAISEGLRNGNVKDVILHQIGNKEHFYGEYDLSWKRIIMKFEDLKCFPQKKLEDICKRLDIPWSDTLLKTTTHGKVSGFQKGKEIVTGFDLKPVYNLYEEFFGEADRLRLMLLNAFKQKNMGYAYENIRIFSKREIQDLYMKPYKFEGVLSFINEEEKWEYRMKLYRLSIKRLQETRRFEMGEGQNGKM